MKRRRYSKSFKLEALRLLGQGDQSGAELAPQPGIRRNLLYKWRRKLEVKGPERAFRGLGDRTRRGAERFILPYQAVELIYTGTLQIRRETSCCDQAIEPMRKTYAGVLSALLLTWACLWGHPALAQFQPSNSDLWDVSNGVEVTSHSTLLRSDPLDMFGGVNAGSVEPGNVVFADGEAQGFVHFVEWRTTAENAVRAIVLGIAHDGPFPTFDANRRGISEFRLFGRNSGGAAFDQLLFSYQPANPYGESEAPPNGRVATNVFNNELRVCVNLSPVEGQDFRAEFVQFGAGAFAGPRVFELDAFDAELTKCPDDLFASSFEAGEN